MFYWEVPRRGEWATEVLKLCLPSRGKGSDLLGNEPLDPGERWKARRNTNTFKEVLLRPPKCPLKKGGHRLPKHSLCE